MIALLKNTGFGSPTLSFDTRYRRCDTFVETTPQQGRLFCPQHMSHNRPMRSLVKFYVTTDKSESNGEDEIPEEIWKYVDQKLDRFDSARTRQQLDNLSNNLALILAASVSVLALCLAQSSQIPSWSDKTSDRISALSDRVNNKFNELKDAINEEKLNRSIENRKIIESINEIILR